MKMLGNNKGIALITTLMLTLISLTMILALLYIVSQNIVTSAAHKRYESSLEAAQGGVELFSKDIIPQLLKGAVLKDISDKYKYTNLSLSFPKDYDNCLNDKLNNPKTNWTNCGADAVSIDAKKAPDVTFTLQNSTLLPGYTVYSKIIDTSPGNTDLSGIDYLENTNGVPDESTVTLKHIPYMYRIEVQGESEKNPKEQAKLSVLYAY